MKREEARKLNDLELENVLTQKKTGLNKAIGSGLIIEIIRLIRTIIMLVREKKARKKTSK